MQQSANSKPAPYSNSIQTKIVTPLFKWLCLLCIISVGFIVDFLYFVDISQQSTTTAIKTKISKGNQPNASLKVGDDLNITKNDIDHPIGDNRNEPRIIHWKNLIVPCEKVLKHSDLPSSDEPTQVILLKSLYE